MGKPNILIVEDEAIVAMDLQQRLQDLGYNVTGTVNTADEAVAKAVQQEPQLVLMDIGLSGECDGIEAARRIREKVDVPVVYLTAHADGDTLDRAKVTEPGGYIVKPYNDREIHATIEIVLHRHEKERRLRKMGSTILDALNYHDDPVVMADSAGNVTYVNGAARELLEKTGTSLDRASILEMMASRPTNGHALPKGMEALSKREHEVLNWFLRGFGTATIGTRLHVSPQTVRNHLKNVCRKLDVRSQVELRELFAEEA
jgi:DNA-binding NarL/FixJ family response regulator